MKKHSPWSYPKETLKLRKTSQSNATIVKLIKFIVQDKIVSFILLDKIVLLHT